MRAHSIRVCTPRGEFWAFCVRVTQQARHWRNSELTAYEVDEMFVDQKWRCAISGISFETPKKRRQPFGPSLDRIVPGGPYTKGNVRLVCNIVNFAMNEWGEAALRELVDKMTEAGNIRGVQNAS